MLEHLRRVLNAKDSFLFAFDIANDCANPGEVNAVGCNICLSDEIMITLKSRRVLTIFLIKPYYQYNFSAQGISWKETININMKNNY